MENNMESENIDRLLKNLTTLEDYLYDLYANLIDSELLQSYSKGVLDGTVLTEENLGYILKTLKQDNLRHRRLLTDSLCFYKKNLLKNKDTSPTVEIQNPDAWMAQ